MAERAARDEERVSRIRSGGGSSAPSPGILLAISGPYAERNFQIPDAGGLIGRSRKCTLSLLHDCEVSHNHALLEVVRGHLCIEARYTYVAHRCAATSSALRTRSS